MNPDAYRIMWTIVLFDLPTETKRDRYHYAQFRKGLLRSGFSMFQYSVYLRHAMSREHMLVHRKRIQDILPPEGKVSIFTFTDKQFGETLIYECAAESIRPKTTHQLELFEEELMDESEDMEERIRIPEEPIQHKLKEQLRRPVIETDETEEIPLGSLLAFAAEQQHEASKRPLRIKKRAKKKGPSEEDGQLFLF
jgi:CRISPR-associated protein Cas2